MGIELKVGQVVKFRNGETGEVVDDEPERSYYDFAVKHHDDGGIYDYVFNGVFDLSSPSQYDIVEILEEPKEEENMSIQLKVDQRVKFRNGNTGVVVLYDKTDETDVYPFKVMVDGLNKVEWLSGNGKFSVNSENEYGYDVVEILEENNEEENMNVKARYITTDKVLFIQDVKQPTITAFDLRDGEIISIVDYSSPIRAKEQMVTYAKAFNVSEIKTH